jgi:AraC family transcriptional regulator of adaptative response / DNA-3-methyladenine glycosylase II
VLTAELGAGPLALARAHRAHSARQLIEMSDLPLTDVAFAAGFSSVRQFNETIREVFAATPSDLRAASLRRGRRQDTPGSATRLSLRLPFRPPFDAEGILRFFGEHALPGVEDVTSESYARTLRLSHGAGSVRLSPQPDHVRCELWLADLRDLGSAVSRVRRLLDLDADPEAVTRVLSADPVLASLVTATPGIRVPGAVDGEELLLRALLSHEQASALVAELGEQVPGDDAVTTLFPIAARIAVRPDLGPVSGVAAALAEGTLDVHVGRDAAELRAELLACPGTDESIADVVLMRVLGAPDILLADDPAVRRGAAALGINPDALGERARGWQPWCSYAGIHLQRV